MAQTYFPFDSGQGSNVTESQWQKMAQYWLGTGVIKGALNELLVYADSTGLRIKVKSGTSWISGHFYESDAEEILAIGTADVSNPRIDRVIIRLDWTANTIELGVLQGTAAVSPVAPALTQNTSRWEISLAQVKVNAGVSTIAAGDVTDERTLVKNANAQQESWITAVLQTGYTHVVGNTTDYYKDTVNIVRFRGGANVGSSSANGTLLFTLPVGYRPSRIQQYSTSYTATDGYVEIGSLQIGTDGTVKMYNFYKAVSSIGFVDVSFRAEQ